MVMMTPLIELSTNREVHLLVLGDQYAEPNRRGSRVRTNLRVKRCRQEDLRQRLL